jgi:twitching motility protein PilU
MKSRPTIEPLLNRFIELKGSDLYLTYDSPPCVRVADRIVPLSENKLKDQDIETLLNELLEDEQRDEFYSTMEFNMPMAWSSTSRFRINVFRQQQHTGIVIRRIQTEIPTVESLQLPKIYNDMIMENRGLILVVGPTGSGKSTSLAAMIGHRNKYGYGHIVTVEDPIEFVHQHGSCIVTQRDVGIDTFSFGMALKHALRQRPDVVLIGEIRDRETMEHALHFAETGHLCVATLHASNTYQALERILNFFPEESHNQIRNSLSHDLRGILAQRLILTNEGTRVAAVEVLLNLGLIRSLIKENKMKEIHDVISKNHNDGMQTLDQALFQLCTDKVISEEVAVSEAENPANLRLLLRQFKNFKTPDITPPAPKTALGPNSF